MKELREMWFPMLIMILIGGMLFFSSCTIGKKALMENKLQAAETINAKLADQLNGIRNDFNGKVSAVEKAMMDFTARADVQLAGIAGVNNKIQKTVNEQTIGKIGGSYNDSKLLETYVKYLSYAVGALIITNFISLALVIIGLIIVIIFQLKSDRINDARRNGLIKKEAANA